MPSFKVPCPSCESQVLIKNPNLVGTKVECPKCKYRFKVEAPADEPAKDDPKADKKDAKPEKEKQEKKEKKAKGGGKGGNKKLVGIGLAVGAVALLGIGGYVMFGGDGAKPKPPPSVPRNTNPSPGDTAANGDGNPDGDGKKEDGDKKKDAPPAPPVNRSDKEPTNLLPGKSVAVYRFDIGKLRQTPLGQMLFDPATADLVKKSLGFELGDIDQYFHCSVGAKERAPVGLIRLRTPVTEKQLAAGVAGAGAGAVKTVNGKVLFPLAGNPLLAAAGNALAGRTLLADVYDRPPPPAPAVAYGVCVYDTQTVFVGEFAALEAHLAGLKDGYPEFQSVVQKEAPPPPPMPMPMPTGDEGAKAPPPPPPPPPAATNKAYTSNPTYLSLDPKLRIVMLAVGSDPLGEPVFVQAEQFDTAQYPRAGVKKDYAPIAAALDPVLTRTEFLGANLVSFTPRQVVGTVRFFTKSDSDARAVALEKLTPTLADTLPILSLLLQTFVEFRNHADPNYMPPVDPNNPNGPMPPGGFGPMPPGGFGPMGPGRGIGPMGPMGPGPVGGGSGFGQPPGGFGPMGPGGFGPMGPGRGIGPMGPGGEGVQPGPGQPMPPTQPGRPIPSHVTLRLVDQDVIVSFELNWPDDTYSRVLGPRLLGFVNQLKGKAAVYSGSDTWHALGRAVKQYTTERKAFPAGTTPVSRLGDHDNRYGVAHPPSQRASFFVELLPYLGRAGLRQLMDPAQGWLHDQNAAQAGSWVPELLVTYYPQTAWRATTPLAPDFTFGGTNFVAVAGVGHDAPRYDPKKPSDAKRAGITGYEWGSKLEEVTDGADKTIYLLQTPPGVPRPWAAGGGATVVGLDPANPMAAFKHKRPDGKEGTYAVMGDGTVRWLPADIAPKTFLAMATRAGGEALPDLDAVAPVVLPAGTKAELKAVAVADPTPPAAPRTAAPTATPQVAPPPREKPAPPANE